MREACLGDVFINYIQYNFENCSVKPYVIDIAV